MFRPRSDSWLLAGAVRDAVRPGAAVLDLCTGSGLVAAAAVRAGAGRVVAVDVSRRAVAAARLNGRLNGGRVEARRGDLFAAVGGERFDLLAANPPYVPAADDALPRRGPSRAWDAGRDGRALLDRICAGAAAHLRPGGRVLLVHSSICGTEATCAALAAGGLEPSVLERRPGALGPLMRSRAALLAGRGLLPAGADREEIVLLAGQAPSTA